MTMNKRRSLFVTGCLMAALVLLGSAGEVLAQTTDLSFRDESATKPKAVKAEEGMTVEIPIEVMFTGNDGQSATVTVAVIGNDQNSVSFYG